MPGCRRCLLGAAAVGALTVGSLYDRVGPPVLYAVPALVPLVPGLAMSGRPWVAVGGVFVWGLAFGLQDSTIKALVAAIVQAPRTATAYGVFAAIKGAAAAGGGVLSGWLYERSIAWLVVVVATTQLFAVGVPVHALHLRARAAESPTG